MAPAPTNRIFLLTGMSSGRPLCPHRPASGERAGRPPVPAAEQAHGGGDEEGTDDGGVHDDREAHADAHALIIVIWLTRPKPKKTPAMMAAAPVMRRPVYARLCATAWALSPVRRYSSWVRLSSSTS